MRFFFENAEELACGIANVAGALGIELADREHAQTVVTVNRTDARMLYVQLEGAHATITYGDGYARFFRALAILADAVRRGETRTELTERPVFKTNGAMLDMSRNAVMNVKAVKEMLCRMALLGMNSCQLYIEDTYEVEKHPYFGHMRGRYSKEELRELDAYALTLGVELVPCIQVLGHLATHLRWAAAAPYRDTERVLLVGAEQTYALISDMIKTVSECFTTRRVHVGMDETADLGLGNYLSRFGYRNHRDIYFEHLNRVYDIVRSFGMEPMMWSDMFFRMAGENIPGYEDYHLGVCFSEEFKQSVPKGFRQVYWDYYHADEHFYAENIRKHRELFGENIMFAGGVWLWSSHCPMYSESLRNSGPALEACRKGGVDEVLATVWLNGSENAQILSLAGLAWYADYDYKGCFDIESVKRCFEVACGAKYDDLIKCELPEHPHGDFYSVTRVLLYNDPLLGLYDRHFRDVDTDAYYKRVSKELATIPTDIGVFSPAVNVIRKLCEVLEHKASFGIRLKAAYDKRDRTALAAMGEECDVVIAKLRQLREVHRASWMTYNKPFGWEVHDIRYGGLMQRFETVKTCISQYLAGEIERIAELEEERLRYDGRDGDENLFTDRLFWYGYREFTTAGAL